MTAKDWEIRSEPSETVQKPGGGIAREIWALPTEEAFLNDFLRDVFENHWDGIRFGPLIEGAAYEWKCPGPPTKTGLMDGYLTVMFSNGGHFHLCIGENRGSEAHPTSPDLMARRKPSKAQMFRGFGSDGYPVLWGFEMWNGANEPMISVFFPNPFIEDDDSLAETPDFARLATWRAVSKRWLGREQETLDELGQGFRTGDH
ncbi:MAG: hypothetical protein AAGE61_08695 [Pseudomonadota bacterium]